MKPKILFFSHYYPPGPDAASITIAHLLEPLGQRAEVMVYVPDLGHAPTAYPGVTYRRADRLPSILTFSVAHFLNAIMAWRDRRRFNPDAIIVEYIPHTFTASAGLLLGRILRRPVIVKAHDIIAVFPANPLKALSVWISSRLNYFLLRSAARVVVVSPELAQRVEKETGLPMERIGLYPNGAKVPARQPEIAKPPAVLFVGGLYPEDGTELLLRGWPQVVEAVPQAHLTLIGDGPERPRFEQLAREGGVANRVTFRGYIPHREVAEAIRAARVCIGTLNQTEQLATAVPNKTVEYFAQGRPVVSSPISTIFRRDTFACVTDPRDIAPTIIKLLSDEKHAILLGTRAWKLAQQQFDWGAIFSSFYEGFTDVVEGDTR